MFTFNKTADSIHFVISSEQRLVENVIREAQEFLKSFGITEVSSFKLVLRELLNNAFEHGNYNISSRLVTCSIGKTGENRFKLVVEDEGKGFDYRRLHLTLPDNPRQIRNRGYTLINAFSDHIDFNDSGNRVTVYLSFIEETTYHITEEGDWSIIIPSGDLKAAAADNLRIRLIELLGQEHRRYRFDFQHVDDIDSVTLSILVIFARTVSDKMQKENSLQVVNMNSDLRDLFHMTRMDQLYQVV